MSQIDPKIHYEFCPVFVAHNFFSNFSFRLSTFVSDEKVAMYNLGDTGLTCCPFWNWKWHIPFFSFVLFLHTCEQQFFEFQNTCKKINELSWFWPFFVFFSLNVMILCLIPHEKLRKKWYTKKWCFAKNKRAFLTLTIFCV